MAKFGGRCWHERLHNDELCNKSTHYDKPSNSYVHFNALNSYIIKVSLKILFFHTGIFKKTFYSIETIDRIAQFQVQGYCRQWLILIGLRRGKITVMDFPIQGVVKFNQYYFLNRGKCMIKLVLNKLERCKIRIRCLRRFHEYFLHATNVRTRFQKQLRFRRA